MDLEHDNSDYFGPRDEEMDFAFQEIAMAEEDAHGGSLLPRDEAQKGASV
jgi:hypothetical protein